MIPLHMFMLIHSHIKIKDYQDIILDKNHGFRGGEASRGMFRCSNPDCRCDTFYRHGTYQRYFVSFPHEEIDTAPHTENSSLSLFDIVLTQHLTILRIRCTSCGQTHAILPYDIVPYHAFSLMLQLMILYTIHNDNDSNSQKKKLHQTTVLSWPFLHALFAAYQAYHSRMCHVLRLKSLYSKETTPSDHELLKFYLSVETDVRSLFLHVFSFPLFLTRRSTVSYPLRFIVH